MDDYCLKYEEELKMAVKNCYMLFDPKKTKTEKEVFDWINANPTDRMILF